jgi:hypothetical protein
MSASRKSPAGSVEFDLLCLIARPRPELDRALSILRGGVDVAELIRLASVHGVRPQLIGSLHDMAWETVSAETKAHLATYQRFHSARALSLSEELCRVAAAFSDKGLSFAAFKGPVLAVALYGDVSRRDYTDLDILVATSQVDDAERLLEQLGYHGADGDRAFRRAFLGHLRQFAFTHPGIDAAIDLHWDFSGVHVPFPLTPAEVWRDLDRVMIGTRAVPTVSGENLALLLAGHGTKEAWRCLGWICDFAMLLDRHPNLYWPELHRRAKTRGCGDALLLGGAMARELLETPVPRALGELIGQSSRVPALAALLARQVRAGELEQLTEGNFTDFHLCDSKLGKLKAMMSLVITPTTGDYEAMKLPQVLWSAYYVTRPVRLAARALAALR